VRDLQTRGARPLLQAQPAEGAYEDVLR